MSIRATFHYFQGMECDMYSFYRIPKLLFTSEYFKNPAKQRCCTD